MPWTPREKEVATMLSAESAKRYEYFIHKVCDTGKMWGLFNDGWVMLGDDSQRYMPIWPHEKYAAAFQSGEWSSCVPREIELEDFLDSWTPKMRQDGVMPAVFPVGSGKSIVVSVDDLVANLEHELNSSYDGAG